MNTKQTKEGWYIIENDSHVGAWIEETGRLDHDQFIIPIIEKMLKSGMIVMDCGALYGDHAIAYARAVGNDGTVICVEANPLAYECLVKNAEKFESTIVCLNVVLGEQHGTTAIHSMEEATQVNVGASRVNSFTSDKKKMIDKEIPTASIDGILMDANLREGVQFIKIDCEGWEYKILLGAKATMEKFKPVMLIEINQAALKAQDTSDKEIYDLLLDFGYEWRIVQSDCTGSSTMFDILAWPRIIETPKLVKA